MSSYDPLTAQQKLMSSWAGRAIDQKGILRVLNEDGTRPPLFWIFNTSRDPETFAKVLGEDQPVVFSRSSHLLVAPNESPAQVRKILSDYLCQELNQHFAGARFDMGTSCQGTNIILQLSTQLQSQGIGVGHLCMINCTLPPLVTHRPALLIYGHQDAGHNPFHHDDTDATLRAQTLFSDYQVLRINAGHGQYYALGTVEKWIAQFDALRAISSATASSSTVGWYKRVLGWISKPITASRVVVRSTRAKESPPRSKKSL